MEELKQGKNVYPKASLHMMMDGRRSLISVRIGKGQDHLAGCLTICRQRRKNKKTVKAEKAFYADL
jgi:hypothetical protein